MKSTRFSRQFCPNCFVCGSYLYRREGDRVRGAGLEKRVNPSHAVRSMPCPAPFSARTPPSGGFFRPFLPPTAPKPRRFRAATPLLSRQNPAGSRRCRAAAARFSRFPPGTAPGCRPKRARCAPFPGEPARFCPGSPFFSAVRPHLARDPACFAPEGAPRTTEVRPENAPPPGARLPLGLPPRPAAPLRRGEAGTPQGGLNPWERFSGDRGPLSRKFPRNSGPGVIAPKNKISAISGAGICHRSSTGRAAAL